MDGDTGYSDLNPGRLGPFPDRPRVARKGEEPSSCKSVKYTMARMLALQGGKLDPRNPEAVIPTIIQTLEDSLAEKRRRMGWRRFVDFSVW